MEPSCTEWKPALTPDRKPIAERCPYCSRPVAKMMKRYITNRDGETEAQYRVECPMCGHRGNTYFHESVARISWENRENDPEEDYIQILKRNRNRYY